MKKLLSIISLMSISIIGSAQIDVHCHMISNAYLEAVKAHGMEMDEGFPIPGWDADAHLQFMDEAGIRTSVLTMPAPQPYFGDGAESAAICRKYNEEAAALKALHPGRFLFCAALPLPDVERALEEAKYALEVLGADIPVREYGERIVRLAEIEVYPDKLDEYLTFAKEVGTVSMSVEPGVIGLFSMQDKANPCKVYILEVYADNEAYQAHLKTAHFKKYKEGTAQMVKSLKLIDTNPLVTATLNKSAVR